MNSVGISSLLKSSLLSTFEPLKIARSQRRLGIASRQSFFSFGGWWNILLSNRFSSSCTLHIYYIPTDVYLRVPKKDEGGYLPYRNVSYSSYGCITHPWSEKNSLREALISCKTRVEGLLPNARRRFFFASFLNVWWFDFRVQKHPSNLGIASFCGNLKTKILVSSVESSHFLAGYFKFLEGAPFLEQRGCLTSIGKDFYWV